MVRQNLFNKEKWTWRQYIIQVYIAASTTFRKGGLHRALHVPEGKKIPAEKLEAAKHSSNSHISKMATFAATMSHFKH